MIQRLIKQWMKPVARFGLVLALFQTSASSEKQSEPIRPHHLVIEWHPLPADILAKTIVVDKRVKLTGAWELTSNDKKFGGISSLLMAGEELLLVSDAGSLVRLRGALGGPRSDAIMVPMPGRCGSSWQAKWRDSESIAVTPDGRGLRIGLETVNGVCAFDPHRLSSARVQRIAAMQGWRDNYGLEAMATLPGQGMALIGEGTVDSTGASPLLWYAGDAADPRTELIRMKLRPPQPDRPTDARFLPDGRMLVVSRHFSRLAQFSGHLMLTPVFAPKTGETVTGTVLARFDDPAIADNFEGVAAQSHAGGTTIWVASDDNFFPLQRTLLLRFELAEG